jgi:cell wall-associated NlpC family hydrolase
VIRRTASPEPRFPTGGRVRLARWFVVVGVCVAGLAGNLATPAGADTVASAQAKAAAIEARLLAAQNEMSALGQKYDAARTQLSQVNSDIVATKGAIAVKQKQVAHNQRILAKDAVASYISGGAAATNNPLFSHDEQTLGAASEYNQIASGDINEAVANLETAKKQLSAQQAQLTAQQTQAQNEVATEQAAVAANQQLENSQSAALSAANAEVASLVQQEQQAALAEAARVAQAKVAAAVTAQNQRIAAARASASVTPPSRGAGSGAGSSGPSRGAPVAPYVPVPVAAGATGAIAAAKSQLGVPYVWGGESPGVGFDCSGLVQWAWGQAGVRLPRTSGEQFGATTPVSIADLEPGDLLFYGPDGSDHVAMYVGGGMMIEAPQTGEVVHLTPLRLGGYGESFAGAGRP